MVMSTDRMTTELAAYASLQIRLAIQNFTVIAKITDLIRAALLKSEPTIQTGSSQQCRAAFSAVSDRKSASLRGVS